MGAIARGLSRFGLVKEFWYFMKHHKAWWMAPIIVVLLGLGMLIVLAEGSALAPFIYTIF